MTLGFFGAITVIIGLFSVMFLEPSDVSTLNNLTIISTAVLARVVIKEKLSPVHILATVLSITGILFIVKPAFIFGSNNNTFLNESINLTLNSTANFTSHPDLSDGNSLNIVFGVVLIVISATLAGATNVIVKKLCTNKVCLHRLLKRTNCI